MQAYFERGRAPEAQHGREPQGDFTRVEFEWHPKRKFLVTMSIVASGFFFMYASVSLVEQNSLLASAAAENWNEKWPVLGKSVDAGQLALGNSQLATFRRDKNRGATKMSDGTHPDDDFEREKWHAEIELKRREVDLKEREQRRLEGEQELRRAEQAKSLWSSPLTVAVFAAAVAATGNAVVAFVNGRQQREVEFDKSRAEIGLERTKAESSRILEMIKTGDEDKAAANLSFLLKSGLVADPVLEEKLNAFLVNRTPGSGPALPSPAGRIGFEQSKELTQPIQEGLENVFAKYFTYLDKIGFPPAKQQVKVKVETGSEPNPNAYYVDNTIVVDQRLADDPSVALREYNHHLLKATGVNMSWQGPFGALESGLADYFACSFLGNSKLGEKSAKLFLGNKKPYIRDLANDRQYSELTKADPFQYPFLGAEVWGGAFWEMRERLTPDVADAFIAGIWLNFAFPDKEERIPEAFVRAALNRAKGTDEHTYEVIASVLRQRKFPLPK